jgi:hypothetical protein
MWHASLKLLDAITIFESLEMQSGVLILQHIVIVRLHTFLLVPTLDKFVLFTCRKWVVGIVV